MIPARAPTWKGPVKLLKADLHIHTRYSMDCDMSLEKIVDRCNKLSINCIAIADHGTIEGALRMQEMAPFKVIIAEEVLTRSETVSKTEDLIREEIGAGVHPLEVWQKYGRF